MAEVLGLVASGLSVAQIAGSIVTTSLKVKALLDEVKDAPGNISDMLEHVQLLTPILCEVTTCDGESACTNPALLPATSHLRQALARCQAASEQLEILATSLISQIDKARGGLRRKHAIVKVVLKKSTLAEYEKRLQRTIQLLSLAHNACTFALYRTLPETIVAQLTSVLTQSPLNDDSPAKMPHDQSSLQIHESHDSQTVTRRHLPTRQNPSSWHEVWQLGFAKVTGLVQIHTPSKGKDDQTISSAQDRLLRIQVHMPTWLCASVLDAVFSQSYAGWACYLNTYGYLRRGSVEFDVIKSALIDDDVDGIQRLFQERRCGPLDWLAWDEDNDRDVESLFQYALRIGAWQACGYLLNYGAAQPDRITFSWRSSGREEHEFYLEALLKRDEINDTVQISCLPSLSKDLSSFTDLISRIWPYNEFYTAAFEDQRLRLAMLLVPSLDITRCSHYPAIFRHLCRSSSLTEPESSATTKVLFSISLGLGDMVWQDQDTASMWHSAVRDTALLLDKVLMMPEQQLFFKLSWPKSRRFPTSTPFTNMFLASMGAVPGNNIDPSLARQHKIGSRLAKCERALQIWLGLLQECGIDLLEYGRQERQRLKDQKDGWEFAIYRDVWYEDPYTFQVNPNGEFEIRLIELKYGREPEDWKLWWSEPTDGLVGDFWGAIEPEPLSIPGSWDEDF